MTNSSKTEKIRTNVTNSKSRTFSLRLKTVTDTYQGKISKKKHITGYTDGKYSYKNRKNSETNILCQLQVNCLHFLEV